MHCLYVNCNVVKYQLQGLKIWRSSRYSKASNGRGTARPRKASNYLTISGGETVRKNPVAVWLDGMKLTDYIACK